MFASFRNSKSAFILSLSLLLTGSPVKAMGNFILDNVGETIIGCMVACGLIGVGVGLCISRTIIPTNPPQQPVANQDYRITTDQNQNPNGSTPATLAVKCQNCTTFTATLSGHKQQEAVNKLIDLSEGQIVETKKLKIKTRVAMFNMLHGAPDMRDHVQQWHAAHDVPERKS